MAIKDVFKDVLKHTHSLGIFEMVKITGTLDKTEIETVDADKTVIFKGETLCGLYNWIKQNGSTARLLAISWL